MSSSTPSLPAGTDPREILKLLPSLFIPTAAGNARATIHLDLHGDGGGKWTVQIADGQCRVVDGLQGQSDLALSAHHADYLQLLAGKLSPMAAFMQGKVKVKGNMGLAMQMQAWFRRPEGM